MEMISSNISFSSALCSVLLITTISHPNSQNNFLNISKEIRDSLSLYVITRFFFAVRAGLEPAHLRLYSQLSYLTSPLFYNNHLAVCGVSKNDHSIDELREEKIG